MTIRWNEALCALDGRERAFINATAIAVVVLLIVQLVGVSIYQRRKAAHLPRAMRLDSAQHIFTQLLARRPNYGPAHNALAASHTGPIHVLMTDVVMPRIEAEGAMLRAFSPRGGETIPALIRAAEHSARSVKDIQLREPSLETLFISLTGRTLG